MRAAMGVSGGFAMSASASRRQRFAAKRSTNKSPSLAAENLKEIGVATAAIAADC
jgi:hypothetical protein